MAKNDRDTLIKDLAEARRSVDSSRGGSEIRLQQVGEVLNPFKSEGYIKYSNTILTLVLIGLINLIVFGQFKQISVPLRQEHNRVGLALSYFIWFVISGILYAAFSNTVIKRWATVMKSEKCPFLLSALVRALLLTPLGSIWVVFGVLLSAREVQIFRGGYRQLKKQIIAFWIWGIATVMTLELVLPLNFTGAIRPRLFKAIREVEPQVPDFDFLITSGYALLGPSLRFVGWAVSDLYRMALISKKIEEELRIPTGYCPKNLGFAGQLVDDCFLFQFRKTGEAQPFAIPLLGYFFELKYRQLLPPVVSEFPGQVFAANLLAISNQIEFLESSKYLLDRRQLYQPSHILRLAGSPDLVLIEAVRDVGRLSTLEKLIPVIEAEFIPIEQQIFANENSLGPMAVDLVREAKMIHNRIRELRLRPLLAN